MRLKFLFETIELDDQTVAVPVGKEASTMQGVLKLNSTAAFILNLLKEDTTEDKIVDALEKEYEVTRDVLVRDVHKYICEFRQKGLIV